MQHIWTMHWAMKKGLGQASNQYDLSEQSAPLKGLSHEMVFDMYDMYG